MGPPPRLAAGLLALILVLPACDGSDEPPAPAPTPVRVQTVTLQAQAKAQRYSANIAAAKQVKVAFQVQGTVQALAQETGSDGTGRDIQAGDSVAKDALLAQVDETSYRNKLKEATAQLAGAQASLRKAEQDFKRAKALFDSQSMTAPAFDRSKKDYESAVAGVASAKAQRNQAQTDLAHCKLTAPLAGVVLQRNVEVGTLVRPDQVGFVVADTATMTAVFGVPDGVEQTLKEGDKQSFTVETIPQKVFDATVTKIAPAADSSTRVFDVTLTADNSDGLLKVGMIASLALQRDAARKLALVPLSAVVRPQGKDEGYAVYLVETSGQGPVATQQVVQLGQVYGDRIAVTAGLSPGAEVIVSGATIVTDGSRVSVIP